MNILDFLLQNDYALYVILVVYLVFLFVVFKKIGKLTFFFLALIIAIKITIHTKLESYIEKHPNLNKFKDSHLVSLTLLVSLLISAPALVAANYFEGSIDE